MSKLQRGQPVFVRGCDRVENGVCEPSPWVLAHVIEDWDKRVLVAFRSGTGWYGREYVRTVDEALAEQIGKEVLS